MDSKRRPGANRLPINTLTSHPPKKPYFPLTKNLTPIEILSLSLPAKTYTIVELDENEGIRYGASPQTGKLLEMRLLPVKEMPPPEFPMAPPKKALSPHPPKTNANVDRWIDRFENPPLLPQEDLYAFSDDDDEFLLSVTQAQSRLVKQESPVDGLPLVREESPSLWLARKKEQSPLPVVPELQRGSLVIPPLNEPLVALPTQSPLASSSPQSPTSDATQSFDIKTIIPMQKERTPEATTASCAFSRDNFGRYIISDITRQQIGANKRPQILLDVTDEHGKSKKLVLRGEYVHLEFAAGDIIHVIVNEPNMPQLIDGDNKNLLIWHPDVLVLATAVASQLTCPRKQVISSRYKGPGVTLAPLVIGVIVHEIFQQCLRDGVYDAARMPDIIDDMLFPYQVPLWCSEVDIEGIKRSIVNEQLPGVQKFFSRYFKRLGAPLSSKGRAKIDLPRLEVDVCLRTEEEIWLPMFGIQGLIDASLLASISGKINGDMRSDKMVIPLEIKTGRETTAHAAQGSLYSLLFKDRHNKEMGAFILCYTKFDDVALWKVYEPELNSLINLRNRVSQYLLPGGNSGLPPLLELAECDRCDIKDQCMALYEMCEEGDPDKSGLPFDEYIDITEHLNLADAEFFNHWSYLLSKEEAVVRGLMKFLWTLTAKQRAAGDGQCIGLLKFSTRRNDRRLVELSRNLLEGTKIAVDDRVIILMESAGAQFCLARATVKELSSSAVELFLRTPIDFDPTQQYRIDQDRFYNSMSQVRYNLLNLFLKDGDHTRRALIVNKKVPRFRDTVLFPISADGLNPDQARAIDHCAKAEDYALVLGMPGTGKTTTIAHLISQLVAGGKSVFLTLYTHSAVDTILLKLKVPYIRAASLEYSVHHQVRSHIPPKNFRTKEQMEAEYEGALVVALTCLALNDTIFMKRRHFDYCIVDEASQVSLPVCLGPISFADKFILVGDHNQLPPLVTSTDPKTQAGLSVSLFQYLADANPESVTELRLQYRMNREIMSLSNHLVYNHQLKCGSDSVREQRLQLSKWEESIDRKWLRWTIDPNNPVVFLNHDSLGKQCQEIAMGERHVENRGEAELVRQIVAQFLRLGLKAEDVGIMAFNRGQVHVLERELASVAPNLEVLSADQYQGRDKQVILILFARLNPERRLGDLVKAWRRLNVALTRAKSKLVCVGLLQTLSTAPTMAKLLDLMQQRGYIYNLNGDEQLIHDTPVSPLRKRGRKQDASSSRLIASHPVIRDVINSM